MDVSPKWGREGVWLALAAKRKLLLVVLIDRVGEKASASPIATHQFLGGVF